MANYHYIDGKWVTPDKLKISVMDLAVLRGFGVFDYLRTYGPAPFLLEDHLDRFANSARVLDLDVPLDRSQLTDVIREGIERNNYKDTGIRMILSGGISEDSVTPGIPTLIIVFQPVINFAEKLYRNGVKVITFPTPRHFPEAKSLNYLTAILAMQKGHRAGAIEALYVDSELAGPNQRSIYEGTRTNFFAYMDGRLLTPSHDVLAGITRKVVIELAKELSMTVVERALEVEEIPKFSEAFVTSSDKEIMPVVQIDDQIIGNGQPGEKTKQLIAAFRSLTRG